MSVHAGAGRFAPSPSGDLHLGNLRTAVLAWLFARSTGRAFVLRMEDLDRVRTGSAAGQIADLAALGISWDGEVHYQSADPARYAAAIARLAAGGLTYECYCTRREIAESASAPQNGAATPTIAGPQDGQSTWAPPHAYPGTCRDLTDSERSARRASGRPPALRLRADTPSYPVSDVLWGEITGVVDDFVLSRGDGVPAYNLAVVVDDGLQGIDQVVRGDDLLSSAPRQAYLAHLLGVSAPVYAHVPLVLGPGGTRLAKRDGAVTLRDLAAHGRSAGDVRSLIASSIGLAEDGESVTMHDLLARFDPAQLPLAPWTFSPPG